MAKSPRSRALSSIKEGALSRSFSLARMTAAVGARAASHALGSIFGGTEEERATRLKGMAMEQAKILVRELGELKGSVMKVGQMVALYGENLLPPEATQILKALQSQAPPLSWVSIEKVLLRELGSEKLAELDIVHDSFASASLGQVHLAIRKSDGQQIALKVQYPGVDRAIGGDLRALKSAMTFARLLPTGGKVDQLFDEIRMMLEYEVDYSRELEQTNRFRELLAPDARYVVPRTFAEYSTRRVLATSFEEGVPVDGGEVAALSQERRDAIATAALELYFKEIFVWGAVQTDPHFGNYRVRLGERGDQLVLFDFGAVRAFDSKFVEPYRDLVGGAVNESPERLLKGAYGMEFLLPSDPADVLQQFAEVTILITEPFHRGVSFYDWGTSDLPKRVIKKGGSVFLKLKTKLRLPPRELIFLDRKITGVFIFLNVLRARIDGRELLGRYLSLD